jgi:hypothetical protein
MRLFQWLKPQMVLTLSTAVSNVNISFDFWTTRGGKRSFFGIATHFATTAGVIHDLPITLPQLASAYTGEAIAAVFFKTLKQVGITPNQLGYFVHDNASNDDTAVGVIARDYGAFDPAQRRIRYGPHTISLTGRPLLSGDDEDSYDNVTAELKIEKLYMREWRQHRQLGTLIAVMNSSKLRNNISLFRTASERLIKSCRQMSGSPSLRLYGQLLLGGTPTLPQSSELRCSTAASIDIWRSTLAASLSKINEVSSLLML